jgi:hypothetical protein
VELPLPRAQDPGGHKAARALGAGGARDG